MKLKNKKILLSTISLSIITLFTTTPIIIEQTMDKEQNNVVLNSTNDESRKTKQFKNVDNIWIIYVVFGVVISCIVLSIVTFQIVNSWKRKKHYINKKRDFSITN